MRGGSILFIWQHHRNFAVSALYSSLFMLEDPKNAPLSAYSHLIYYTAKVLPVQNEECSHFRANILTHSLRERWKRRRAGGSRVGFLAFIFVRQMTPGQIKPHRRQQREGRRGTEGRRDGGTFSLHSTVHREKEVAFQTGGPDLPVRRCRLSS